MNTDFKGQRMYMPPACIHSKTIFKIFFNNYLGFHSRLLEKSLLFNFIMIKFSGKINDEDRVPILLLCVFLLCFSIEQLEGHGVGS